MKTAKVIRPVIPRERVSQGPEEHTKAQERKLRRYFERRRKSMHRHFDKGFMDALEDIYAGGDERFNTGPDGEYYSCRWRLAGSVFPDREAELVIWKKHGKPVVTIREIVIPDEKTKLEMKRKGIESGKNEAFNDLAEGHEYFDLDTLGPGEDIWHVHQMKVVKKNGKPEISVVDCYIDYGVILDR